MKVFIKYIKTYLHVILSIYYLITLSVGILHIDEFTKNLYYFFLIITSLFLIFELLSLFLRKGFYLFSISFFCMTNAFFIFDIYKAFLQLSQIDRYNKAYNQTLIETARKLKIDYDKRTKYQFILDNRRNGFDIYPFITISDYLNYQKNSDSYISKFKINQKEILPLNGIGGQKEIVVCNERGDWWRYKSDRYGYNNPDEVWDEKFIDLAFVGDSFTHGSCINGEKIYVELLRDNYAKTLNLGWGGTGPLTYLGVFKEYLVTKKPKILFFSFYEGNDLVGLEKFKKVKNLKNYLNPSFSQNLVKYNDDINDMLKVFLNNQIKNYKTKNINLTKKQSSVFYKIKFIFHPLNILLLKRSINEKSFLYTNENLKILKAILLEIKNTLNKWDGELVFLYMPSNGNRTHDKIKLFKNIASITKSLNIDLIDLIMVFKKHGRNSEKIFTHQYSHYSVLAHKLIATEILSYLKKRNLTKN